MNKIERMIVRSGELQQYMTDIRRSLHRFPETGWLEMRTSALIAKELTKMGCKEGDTVSIGDVEFDFVL